MSSSSTHANKKGGAISSAFFMLTLIVSQQERLNVIIVNGSFDSAKLLPKTPWRKSFWPSIKVYINRYKSKLLIINIGLPRKYKCKYTEFKPSAWR